jgi:hypothetical protein
LSQGDSLLSSDSFYILWQRAVKLPEQFSLIPDSHGMSYVRASKAGTIESKLAILKVMLPQEKTVATRLEGEA